MQVGSHSFYKCPVCPNRSFMNSTYLQGHLVRRHPEHVHYIGDAVAHTKVKFNSISLSIAVGEALLTSIFLTTAIDNISYPRWV